MEPLTEAQKKYDQYKLKDPFPRIPPALLNADDVKKYITLTGMIDPFYPEDLKGVSYRINILGEYIFWDGTGKKESGIINIGDHFVLKSNTLAFVTIEPLIQLPAYIIARFNLTVNNVYRGLLLGTGPMVDAGFVGRLHIPLHNFTTNDYTFVGGEHFISMEFTKVTPNPLWISSPKAKPTDYKLYPANEKKSWNLEDYLKEADRNRPPRPIRSSIPEAIYEAQEAVRKATESVSKIEKKMDRTVLVGIIVGVLSIIIAVAGSYFDALGIHEKSLSLVRDVQENLVDKYKNPEIYSDSLSIIRKEIDTLRKEVEGIKTKQKK
jgi:deoxycytidine triphosphate deaminase